MCPDCGLRMGAAGVSSTICQMARVIHLVVYAFIECNTQRPPVHFAVVSTSLIDFGC